MISKATRGNVQAELASLRERRALIEKVIRSLESIRKRRHHRAR
jgi:hypothetical protein